jgi:hypothetical protein
MKQNTIIYNALKGGKEKGPENVSFLKFRCRCFDNMQYLKHSVNVIRAIVGELQLILLDVIPKRSAFTEDRCANNNRDSCALIDIFQN